MEVMAKRPLNTVARHLCQSMLALDAAARTDGELLEDYITHSDPAAFEELVCRHGPMVLGVCRRILGNAADADDAFQATFLVLVRKASSIQPRSLVSHWLYGVARNTALKARTRNRVREVREREASTRSEPAGPQRDDYLRDWLDEALSGLPEKYRVPIILCHLEGKTIQEVARELDWPPGTVACRLARGRDLLGQRLAANGQELPPRMPALLVPPSLLTATVQGAIELAAGHAPAAVVSPAIVALMEGVLRTMLLTKVKQTTLLVLTVLVTLGFGFFLTSARGVQDQPDPRSGDKPLVAPDELKPPQPLPPAGLKVLAAFPIEGGGPVLAAALAPDNRGVAIVQAQAVTFLALENGKLIWRIDQPRAWDVAFSPDGKRIAMRGIIADTTTGKIRTLLGGHEPPQRDSAGAVVWTPDGKMVAIAGGQKIRLWDAVGPEVRAIATQSPVRALAISPDGKQLAIDSGENRVTLIDLSSGAQKLVLAGHVKEVLSVLFAPDGKLLATGSADGTVRLWHVETGKLVAILKGHTGPVAGVAWSPDGKILATVGQLDQTLRLWDPQTGKELASQREHSKPLANVFFSTDGKLIVTVGYDAIRVWERDGRVPPPIVPPALPQDRPDLAERLAGLPTELIKSKKGDNDLVEALYLAVIQRLPAEGEREHGAKHLKIARNREEAARDLLWALVNSVEFLNLRGNPDNPAAAREFTAKISRAWEKKTP
jgi:RNA polymerase sigma factor (sigma-70 family)